MSSSAAQTAAQQTDFRDSGLSRIPSLASKMPDYYQRYLCSYEYADGVCRDSSCRDVHFRDL
ncbi:hypothetical protein DL93DRAFT_2075802 [Clavulina sp. PMI_390]|nr:hypothetical protein DL93DRAFT_2075802 [Clavulina sp. PMI_390]